MEPFAISREHIAKCHHDVRPKRLIHERNIIIMTINTINIYTDGGARPNPGHAGIGVLIQSNPPVEIYEYLGDNRTNNEAEIIAITRALEAVDQDANIVVHSDSQYALKSVEGVFNGDKNRTLYMQARTLVSARKGTTTYKWVRGHDGNIGNSKVDDLATLAITTRSSSPNNKKQNPNTATNDTGAIMTIRKEPVSAVLESNTIDAAINDVSPTNTPLQIDIEKLDIKDFVNPYDPKFSQLAQEYKTCEKAMQYFARRGVPWEYAVLKGAIFVPGSHGATRGKLYHEKHLVPNKTLPAEVMNHKEFQETYSMHLPVDSVVFKYRGLDGRKYARARYLEEGYNKGLTDLQEKCPDGFENYVDLSGIRYMTPKMAEGECVPPFFNCLSNEKVFEDPKIDLFIVEGAAKAMAMAHNLGVQVIALGGVNAGALDAAARRTLGRLILNKYLKKFKIKGRNIFIVFDAGRVENPLVALAQVILADVLRENGAVVKYVEIPLTDEDEDQGPDDYFVNVCKGDATIFRDLISKAIPSGLDLAGRSFEDRMKDLTYKAEIYHAIPSALQMHFNRHKSEIGQKTMLSSLGDDFKYLLREKMEKEARANDPRVQIKWDPTRLNGMVKDTIKALGMHPDIYVKSNVLVQHYPTTTANANAGEVMIPFTPDTLSTTLTDVAKYSQYSKTEGEIGIVPPALICKSTMNQGAFPAVKNIRCVVRHPIIRPNGTIHWNGYDPATGYLVLSDLPEQDFTGITKEDARAALQEIIEVYEEFPYENLAHRSVALAMFLTLPARPAIKGPVPMYIWDGSDIGSGKSMQTDIPANVWQGRDSGAEPTTYLKTEESSRKAFTSTLMGSPEMVTFVNIYGSFGNDVIDNLITKGVYKDRILGITKDVILHDIPATFCLDGCNITLKNTDTSRRVLYCRLIARPDQSTRKYKIPLEGPWLQQNRNRLMLAGLKVLSAYFQAGKPCPDLVRWNSFTAFSELIRGVLVWLGQEDPHGNFQTMKDNTDLKANKAIDLIQALIAVLRNEPKCQATSQEMSDWAAEVRKKGSVMEPNQDKENLTTALEALCLSPRGREISADDIGYKIRGIKDAWRNGWSIVQTDTGRPRPWTLKYQDGRVLSEFTKEDLDKTLTEKITLTDLGTSTPQNDVDEPISDAVAKI